MKRNNRALARSALASGVPAPSAALALLGSYGIAVLPAYPVGDVEAAAATARAIGFPVALKLDEAAVRHKTEVGGVRLGLRSESEVRAAFAAIAGRGRTGTITVLMPIANSDLLKARRLSLPSRTAAS